MNENLKRAFAAVAGEDLEIDAYELRDILNPYFKKGDAPNPFCIFRSHQASKSIDVNS